MKCIRGTLVLPDICQPDRGLSSMGLDAVVCCDCFERGRLRVQPDPNWHVYVDVTGYRTTDVKDRQEAMAFDKWDVDACEHELGVFLHCRIGNIMTVALLREELSKAADSFPIILSKVIYDGTHGGDHLTVDEVAELLNELNMLEARHSENSLREEYLRYFEGQLRNLIDTSLKLNKPISF
jgi:hypothetical protein